MAGRPTRSGGRNKLSAELHVVRGTYKPSRHRAPTAAPVLTGAITPPAWLTGQALELWHTRVAVYERRGLGVVGCEGPLAQLCALEAVLIEKRRTGKPVRVGELDAFRMLATEFGETPRSAQAIGPGPIAPPANRFAIHRPPTPSAPRDSEWEPPAT